MNLKSIFIKKYPYINLILAFFRVLINEKTYMRTQKRGQKIIDDIENVLISIISATGNHHLYNDFTPFLI